MGSTSKISAAHFGCSTARNKGPTECTNLRTIRRTDLEGRVLGVLRERLMDPALFKAFAEAFTSEWNRLQAGEAVARSSRADELRLVRVQIERLVDAIAKGTPGAALRDRLESLEARRLAMEARAASASAPAPRMHPALAEVYRQKVANLVVALEGDHAVEARDLVRPLVDSITLHPEGKGQRV
jgi:site-specific DNA recombinase